MSFRVTFLRAKTLVGPKEYPSCLPLYGDTKRSDFALGKIVFRVTSWTVWYSWARRGRGAQDSATSPRVDQSDCGVVVVRLLYLVKVKHVLEYVLEVTDPVDPRPTAHSVR